MTQNHKIKKFTIYLNGKYKNSHLEVTCDHLHSNSQNETIYVADGGLNSVLKHAIKFKKLYWIGDGDSLKKPARKFIEHEPKTTPHTFVPLHTEKNFSDFAALLDIILAESQKNKVYLEIFAGLGGRKDHELSNLLEAEKFLNLLPQGGLCYFHGGIVLSSLSFKINGLKNKFFSVFARKQKDEKSSLLLAGAKYSGNIILQRPSHGLSNKGNKNTVSFSLSDTSLYWICF